MKKFFAISLALCCAGCNLISKNKEKVTDLSGSGLDSSTSVVEFRQRFIGGHEIYKTCEGFPALAISPEGNYLIANTKFLGDSSDDWSSISLNQSTYHDGQYILIALRNNVPILARSTAAFGSTGLPALDATTNYCAIFTEPSVAFSLLSQWSGSNYDQTAWAAGQDLINDQGSIGQPVLASWTYVRNPDEGEQTLLSKNMNLSAGMRSINGFFSTKSGNHELMAECRDLFNTQPDTTCSAPLDIQL